MKDERTVVPDTCTMPDGLLLAIALLEFPCDRCNMDRKMCKSHPRKDGLR